MRLTVKYGGKQGREYSLEPSTDMIVVRSENYNLPEDINLNAKTRRALDQGTRSALRLKGLSAGLQAGSGVK